MVTPALRRSERQSRRRPPLSVPRDEQRSPDHRRADIQGLRGIAVLAVVLFHVGAPVSGGFVGVDIFFVISGFVITGVLLKDLTRSGGVRFASFYARRARRLLPALAIVLVFVEVAGAVASPAGGQRLGASNGMFASLFAANLYLYRLGTGYFDVSTTLDPLLHTWTLAVEEQFYLVFPVLLLVGWRFARVPSERGRRLSAAVIIAAACVLSYAACLILSLGHRIPGIGEPQRFAFYASPTRAWEFGIGAVLALATPVAVRRSRLTAEGLVVAGVTAILVAVFTLSPSGRFPGTGAALPVCGAALLLLGGSTAPWSSRLVSNPPLRWIGDVSYGWYLWHWPLIVFATALWPTAGVAPTLAAVVALICAWASFRYVERPIRTGPRFRGRGRVMAIVGVGVLVPLAVSAGALAFHNSISTRAPMKEWARSQAWHADLIRGCDNPTPLDERTGGACTWRTPHPRGTIVLVGDSNAGHLTEAFAGAASRAHFDFEVATLSACPFVGVTAVGEITPERDCRRFFEGTMRALIRNRPALVAIGSRTDAYLDRTEPLRAANGDLAYRRSDKVTLWRRDLGIMLQRLASARVPVVLINPVPVFRYSPTDCAVLRVLARSCKGTMSRHKVDESLAVVRGMEDAAARSQPGTSVLDLTDELCGARTCSTMRGNTILYRNTNHLSVTGAELMTARVYDLVAAAARQ